MVRSRYLTPEHLIRAMKQGDFYASSGVTLTDVTFDEDAGTLSLQIDPAPGARYTTSFIATLGEDVKQDRIGRVMAKSSDLSPSYTLQGNELYVRAVVTSDQPPDDPSFDGQLQQAWSQPVGWQAGR